MMARKTKRFRHFVVKVIAPQLYKTTRLFPRPTVEFVKENFAGKPLVGVEIGVAEGLNAENILKTLLIQKLYLIDPYTPYLEDGELMTRYAYRLLIAKKKLSKFKEKIVFIIKKASEALDDIPEKVDFVYIDDGHDYVCVKRQIQLYYPKVREGGIIGGHDFTSSFLGLCKAVFEFAKNNNLTIYGKQGDWWMVKPKE